MSGFETDDEPRTIRIKADDQRAGRFVDAKTEEIEGPNTEELEGASPPSRSAEPGLDEVDLFKGLKSIIPFLLEVEIPAPLGKELGLVRSDETPPFIKAIWEDAKGGARGMLAQRQATSLRGVELPFCGLLGCYKPAETTVVIYNQGLDWVLSVLEEDLRLAIPPSLSSRPLRELHVADPAKVEQALRTYLRWLLVDLTMLHLLGHAIVHLGLANEAPWRSVGGFEALPLDLQEHLAQSIVATALAVKELAAPFPPSDLAAVFHRLSLGLRAECRAWVMGRPWSQVDEVPRVIHALRDGHLPRLLVNH